MLEPMPSVGAGVMVGGSGIAVSVGGEDVVEVSIAIGKAVKVATLAGIGV